MDFNALLEAVKSGAVKEHDLWSRLSDEERATYLQTAKRSGWDAAQFSPKDTPLGGIPEAAAAVAGGGVAAKGLKGLGSTLQLGNLPVGDFVRTAAMASAFKALGLPPWMAAMIGKGNPLAQLGGATAVEEAPALGNLLKEGKADLATSELPSQGGGVQLRRPDPIFGGRPSNFNGRPDGAPMGTPKSDFPPNLKGTRTVDDIREQVTGSSRNGYEDTHHSFNNEQYPLDAPSGQLLDKLKAVLDQRSAAAPPSRPAVPTGFQDRGPVADQLHQEAFDRVANRQGMGQNVVGQTPASTPNPRLNLGGDQPPEVERPIRSRRRKVSGEND